MAMSKDSQECFTPEDSQALVTVREDVIRFLLGEAAFDGHWYGEKPLDKPMFWWRTPLRLSMHPFTPQSETEPRYSADFIRDAIDAEPELPGEMPDAMWEAMKDREYCTEAMRIAVRQTKRGIKERILKGIK
jgi:hypothetical protein